VSARRPTPVATIRPLKIGDYAKIITFWKTCEGLGIGESDSRKNIALFLKRNPGLNFIATTGKTIAGTVLCGHDGRRGAIYHLAVAKEFRRQGLGKTLVAKALAKLKKQGIHKCRIIVFSHNLDGQEFWRRIGWEKRDDLLMMSITTTP
jgi:ribosomal protein S18 acetylase RimI-like enzyme